MKITNVVPFLLHVPVTGNYISDSVHQVTHWGVPGVILETDSIWSGYGYTGTHAHLPTDLLITDAIRFTYGPLLMGQDPGDVLCLWRKLHSFPPAQWVGRAGILKLALAAVDVALWDLKAKAAGAPLWQLLGGARPDRIIAYNSNCGWLSIPDAELVDGCRRLVDDQGWRGIKIKIGSPDPWSDLARIKAVRSAVGPSVRLMVDANGAWDLPTAVRYGQRLADYDVAWFEEPLWYDDTEGHAHLARAIKTPVALGEQLYSVDAFRQFIGSGAVHYVQPDAVRLGGVTEWWQVADLALSHRLPVAPHAGDMVQIHAHLALAHPACTILEYIPWLRECFEEPVEVRDGDALAPRMPGAGTTLRRDARARFGVPLVQERPAEELELTGVSTR
jgi:L-alanine-DL-glutamate epimerase-like enolase superfamily enzyme